MKPAALLFLAALLILPARAAEESAAKGAKKGGAPGTNVDLPYLMAPLLDDNGKLLGYAYITSRLTVATESDKLTVTEKMPFLQDARVRDVNANPVFTPGDHQKIDVAGVEARMLANARKIVGASRVKVITICTVQIALLHIAQTPSPSPPDARHDVDDHGNPVKSRCEAEKPA